MRHLAASLLLGATLLCLPVQAAPHEPPADAQWNPVIAWLEGLWEDVWAALASEDGASYENQWEHYGGMVDPLGGDNETQAPEPPPPSPPDPTGDEHGGMIDPLG